MRVAFARVVSYARCMELLTHDELVRLTPPERLALISQLWDSLEDDNLLRTARPQVPLFKADILSPRTVKKHPWHGHP